MRFFTLLLLAGMGVLLGSTPGRAQYSTPMSFWLSPQFTAPTAMSAYGYKQISAHYQKQALAHNFGARSMILSGQFPLMSSSPLGMLGLNLMRQETGSAYLLATTGALLSYNYSVRLSDRHHLIAGAQGGYFSRRIDWSRVTTSNQIEGGEVNPGLGHGEVFNDYQSQAFTTNVGLAYSLLNHRGEQQFHVGAGLINANKGRFTYLEDAEGQANGRRLVVYSHLRLISTPFYELGSNLYWQQQSQFNDVVGGLQFTKGINARKPVAEEHLALGLYYSPDQSTILSLQLLRNNLLLGMSYSTPLGAREIGGIQNAAEITIGWRVQPASRPSFYGGSNRSGLSAFSSGKGTAAKKTRIATAYKKKIERKSARAFKKKARGGKVAGSRKAFSKKVSGFKAKAGKKKFSYKKSRAKSSLAKKYRKAQKKYVKKLKRQNKARSNNRNIRSLRRPKG